jgi:RNA polymerase sigma-70 factor (ECF subfamily)
MTGGDNAEDIGLIAQILQGYPELFRLLVQRYRNAVFSMGMGFFHNRDDAADFSQDVFLKVYKNLSQFRGKARFSTWLYRVAYNTGINGIRRRDEYRSLAGEDITDTEGPERRVILEAAKSAVKAAVAELPERYRICLDLFFFYDRSYREIETITGFPVNTVKSHVFRAKKLLQEKLGGLVWEG